MHSVVGAPMDPGLAAYYASALSEHDLHPAWSVYLQQHHDSAAEAAAQQVPLPATHGQAADETQTDASQPGAPLGSQQHGGPVHQIQQGFAMTRQRFGKALDEGRAAADRLRASSAQLVKDKGLPWSSSSAWKQKQAEPAWPAQPTTPGTADSAPNLDSKTQSTEADSNNIDPVTDNSLLPGQEESDVPNAAAPAMFQPVGADSISNQAKQLLASFRLHSTFDPSILSSLSLPVAHALPLQQQDFLSANTQFTESGIKIPGSKSVYFAGGTGWPTDPSDPTGLSSYDHAIEWDPLNASRGTPGSGTPSRAALDPAQQGLQPVDPHSEGPSSSKQLLDGPSPDQTTPTPLGRPGRGRVGSASGRDDAVVEPRYTPGVPAPPRGTLHISATAGAVLLFSGTDASQSSVPQRGSPLLELHRFATCILPLSRLHQQGLKFVQATDSCLDCRVSVYA